MAAAGKRFRAVILFLLIIKNVHLEEMRKKEKIMGQVLDQTKSIRKSFEQFQNLIETKNEEISTLKQNISDLQTDVAQLKFMADRFNRMEDVQSDNGEELSKIKGSYHKMKVEYCGMDRPK